MLRKLFIIALCLVATIFTTQAKTQTPPDNEIWYTTIDGEIARLGIGEEPASENGEDFEIVSHTYENGRGVVRANKPIKVYGDWDQECVYREYSIGFWLCGNIESIILPKGLIIFGNGAFYGCSSLTSITIPDSVTAIGDSAFAYCSSLTSITIPDSVTSIGDHAFYGCSSLTSITIPDSVTAIGDRAFYGCSNLKSFYGKFASDNGRCLINNGTLIAVASAGLSEYTIPESVTAIGDGAFAYCSSLTSITIPDSVTAIGDYAFNGCYALKDVNVNISDLAKYCTNNAIHKITGNKHLFIDNKEITELVIPDGVTSIGHSAFDSCSSLTSINIPNIVIEIGVRTFYDCSSLTSITIPDSVTSIGWCAFAGCSSLTSITIPDSVTSIGYSAFAGCSSLTSITIPEGVTEIGGDAFCNCSSLTSVTIGNSVTTIGEDAFYGCDALKDININITDLAKYCTNNAIDKIPGNKHLYIDNKEITKLIIPDGVTTIGDRAFRDCSSLTNITIPDSVTEIGEYAFYECNKLAKIVCLATEPPQHVGDWSFSDLGISASAKIYVPKKSVKAYKQDEYWSQYAKQIVPIK